MRSWVRALAVAATVFLAPAAVFAQEATIAGVVKDGSGAVLPGVSVEASSPVLTEKVRAVVTDGTGQYRIVSLPPGTYTITFSLQGFSTVRREGLQLTGALTARTSKRRSGSSAVISSSTLASRPMNCRRSRKRRPCSSHSADMALSCQSGTLCTSVT